MKKNTNKYIKVGLLTAFVYLIFYTLEDFALEFFHPLEKFYYWLIYAYATFNICFSYVIKLNIKENREQILKYKYNKQLYDNIMQCVDDLIAAGNSFILEEKTEQLTDRVITITAEASYYLSAHMDFSNAEELMLVTKRLHTNLAFYNIYIQMSESKEKIEEVVEYVITDIKYFVDAIRSSKIFYKELK